MLKVCPLCVWVLYLILHQLNQCLQWFNFNNWILLILLLWVIASFYCVPVFVSVHEFVFLNMDTQVSHDMLGGPEDNLGYWNSPTPWCISGYQAWDLPGILLPLTPISESSLWGHISSQLMLQVWLSCVFWGFELSSPCSHANALTHWAVSLTLSSVWKGTLSG